MPNLAVDDDEERQFLEALTLRIWKARAEGAIVGAAFVLGIGFLLYLIVDAEPLNPMSVKRFLNAFCVPAWAMS